MVNTLTLQDIADAARGKLISGVDVGAVRISGVSTDTRTLERGNLFVALSGERFDGHDFVHAAFDAGAAAALVAESWIGLRGSLPSGHPVYIAVPDTLDAFQRLAGWYRRKFDIPVVTITGSSGKTTTKDMIAAVLGRKYRLLKTPGNLNSQIGTPQVLFSLNEAHQMAVLELGMNHEGEMSRLGAMTRPTVAVITNVGPVHLEFLKTVEGVARAKGELLDHLDETGWAVLNGDDETLMRQISRTRARIMTFGLNEHRDVRAVEIDSRWDGSTFRLTDGTVYTLRIPGVHHVLNALAAITAGRIFNMSYEVMRDALEAFEPSPMRMNQKTIGCWHVINDAYNANPASTSAALRTLALCRGRRVAVLGDMLELGDITQEAHRRVGELARQTADVLFAVGERARDIAEGATAAGMPPDHTFWFPTRAEAAAALLSRLKDGDFILVKGSRGMKMEEIVHELEKAGGLPDKEP